MASYLHQILFNMKLKTVIGDSKYVFIYVDSSQKALNDIFGHYMIFWYLSHMSDSLQ